MRSHPMRLLLGASFLVIMIALGFVAGRIALFAFAPARSGAQTKDVVVITKGQGPNEIAKLLASKSAVSDPERFIWLGRLTRQWKRIKAGEYEVSPGMTPIEVFSVITSGISVNHPITVREGENMYEIAAEIEAKRLAPRDRFLALCKDRHFMASLGLKEPMGPSLEGYLFPDTYFFNRTMTPEDMVRQMVRRFLRTWTPEHETRAKLLGMTQIQVLTLASMVEKETGAQHERPVISSVFHNRLRKKMRLQSDPTTIYGIWEAYKGNIHRSDLLKPTPYNTYTIPGLPIGPISNPGKEAIEAALKPAQTNYIFFVSHNDGTHEFTSTLQEHNRAVRRFQMDPKARIGKSWRDLRKSTAAQGQNTPVLTPQNR